MRGALSGKTVINVPLIISKQVCFQTGRFGRRTLISVERFGLLVGLGLVNVDTRRAVYAQL